jgi:hypothetical protein
MIVVYVGAGCVPRLQNNTVNSPYKPGRFLQYMKLSSTFFQSQKSGAKRLLAILSRSSKNGSFCVLKSKVADQDLKRNTQQIWQSLCVLALLTKQNETTIFF